MNQMNWLEISEETLTAQDYPLKNVSIQVDLSQKYQFIEIASGIPTDLDTMNVQYYKA